MTPSKRLMLASILAAASTLAVAQAPASPAAATGPAATAPAAGPGAGWRQKQRSERHAKHLERLKADLKLSPAQEGAWNQFSAAMQPPAPDARGPASRADFARLSTPERIDLMQKRADERHARMKQRGDATKAFYAQLTPEQQKSFDSRAQRAGRGEGWHGGHGEHRGWGRGMGPGPR